MLEDINPGQKLGDAAKGEQQFFTCFDEQEFRVFVTTLQTSKVSSKYRELFKITPKNDNLRISYLRNYCFTCSVRKQMDKNRILPIFSNWLSGSTQLKQAWWKVPVFWVDTAPSLNLTALRKESSQERISFQKARI